MNRLRCISPVMATLALALALSACGTWGQKKTDSNATEPKGSSDTVDSTVVAYFETFRERLLNGETEGLAELVHFPVEGDYSWEQLDRTGELELAFNPYRTKADFVQNHSKLFGKGVLNHFCGDDHNVTGEKLVEAIANMDIATSLRDGTGTVVGIEPNMEFSFSLHPNGTEHIDFSIHYDETDCDVCESTIAYRFRKTNGRIKLVMIFFAG